MITVDDLAKQLNTGEKTVEQVLDDLSGNGVLVYEEYPDPAGDIPTWDEVEDQGAYDTTLYPALYKAGASEEAVDYATEQVGRLRKAGLTLENWIKKSPTTPPGGMTPTTEE